MTGLVEAVGKKVDGACVTGRIKKDGCSISLNGAPQPRLIIDFDKLPSLRQDQKRCDYLFVAEVDEGSGWIVPLELKRGRLHADEAVRQLQAGARAAEGLVPSGAQVRFRPVAVARSKPKAERNRLKSKGSRVRFHGRAEVVRLLSCGAALVGALDQ